MKKKQHKNFIGFLAKKTNMSTLCGFSSDRLAVTMLIVILKSRSHVKQMPQKFFWSQTDVSIYSSHDIDTVKCALRDWLSAQFYSITL